MLEFLPWSKKVLNEAFEEYRKTGILSILDIELGGSCNFNCQYCDTPKYGLNITYKPSDLEDYFRDNKVHFLYICGLGEPTFNNNFHDLIRVLELCQTYGIKCCVFTNLSILNDSLLYFIDQEILFPIFKLDSFDVDKIKQIYSINDTLANDHLNNILQLTNHVKVRNNYTNIAASIVPSSLNISEVNYLIKWCKENNVFPLIGQLENAGKGRELFSSLSVDEMLLETIKEKIYEYYSEPYLIPICPSVLFGIHINHNGIVIVDRISGLSCHWFWLDEPKIKELGPFYNKSIEMISKEIIDYRKKQVDAVIEIYHKKQPLVFGGCGGDVKYLLSFYLENMI